MDSRCFQYSEYLLSCHRVSLSLYDNNLAGLLMLVKAVVGLSWFNLPQLLMAPALNVFVTKKEINS